MKQNYQQHGMTYTPEYRTWQKMKVRCYDPNDKRYPEYGGRGIVVDPSWLNDFMAFYNYIGDKPTPKHSIDRIDSDGNYEPGNVRWATDKEQNNNTRRNRYMELNGEKLTVKMFSEKTGQSYHQVLYHLNRGLTGDEIAKLAKPDRGDVEVLRETKDRIDVYPSIKAAAKLSGVPQSTIRRHLQQMFIGQEWRVVGDRTKRKAKIRKKSQVEHSNLE